MGFFTIISQNNNSKKDNSVPLSIQIPYGSLNKKKHSGLKNIQNGRQKSKMAAKILSFKKIHSRKIKKYL